MKIHNYEITGRFKDDSKMISTREKYEEILVKQMREQGRVPVLDMATQWRTSYVPDLDAYDFHLVVYGVFCGKRKAWQIEGWEHERNVWRERDLQRGTDSSDS